jgi:miniconductance mechanosensitive channel
MHNFINNQSKNVVSFLENSFEFDRHLATVVGELFMLFLILVFAYVSYKITVRILWTVIIPLLKRTKNQFDDLLVKHSFFRNIAYLVPALFLYEFTKDTVVGIPVIINLVEATIELAFVVIFILVSNSVLDTVNDFYERYDFAKDHPINAVIQIVKIVSYIVGIITIVAILFNKDLSSLVMSLGAVSAVLMLIFKDPILGFVGGLQLIFNKMLSIGDWISMPKFGADGTVNEINLTTVKVQNWDKTIVTIPTYSLISESFQNWKGMEESGGRRIKRAIHINMNTIKFCTPEMLEKYTKIDVLSTYIEKTEKRVIDHNNTHNVDSSVAVNGRRQTNIGVFRAYLEAYLTKRSDINKNMTFMVRQLPPNEKGLPIEIYVFTGTTEWVEYEGIQSDIFDHVLAVVPEFDLQVYQYPTDTFVVGE